VKKKSNTSVAAEGAPKIFSVNRQVHKERRDSEGDEFNADMEWMVHDNPGRCIRSIARELKVSLLTVSEVVKKKMKTKSFVLTKVQFINAATQDCLKDNVTEFLKREARPPSSPDCYPLDCYIWCVLDREVDQRPYTTEDKLKTAIAATMGALPRGDVIRACWRFQSRLEDVVKDNRDFMEEKLLKHTDKQMLFLLQIKIFKIK